MLYATIDYSGKKSLWSRYVEEEVLGEVKISIPHIKESHQRGEAKKILKKLKKYKVDNLVLHDELNQFEEFRYFLTENQKQIINGSRMSKALLPLILSELANLTKYPEEKMRVLLLMNEYSIENIDLIECLSQNIKQLTVVSHNYTKYQKTSHRLLEEYGYVVKLYGKDFTEAKKENIIINLDFSEEEIKRLSFNRFGIIISFNEEIAKVKKWFNGVIIRDVDIMGEGIPKTGFHKLSICEARLYRPFRKLQENKKVFEAENYKINGFIGKNGKITEEEFENIAKNFT